MKDKFIRIGKGLSKKQLKKFVNNIEAMQLSQMIYEANQYDKVDDRIEELKYINEEMR